MDENNKQSTNKQEAVKWLKLAILFFVLAMVSAVSSIFLNGGRISWILLVCFPAFAVCLYKLNRLGYVAQGAQTSRKPYVPPEDLAGIAGKTYTIGTHTKWPYY